MMGNPGVTNFPEVTNTLHGLRGFICNSLSGPITFELLAAPGSPLSKAVLRRRPGQYRAGSVSPPSALRAVRISQLAQHGSPLQ